MFWRLGRTLARFVLVAAVVACGKRDKPGPAPAASFSALVPMDDAPPLAPAASLSANAPLPAPSTPESRVLPDLPEDAGEARCPTVDGASARVANVSIELVTSPKPTTDLVIPALGLRKRLWEISTAPMQNPNSCSAWRDPSGTSLHVDCSEVMTGMSAKIYARGSDVIVAIKRNFAGEDSVIRHELPCGSRPRFEAVACPARCRQPKPEEPEWHCSCSELDEHWRGPAPAPPSTSRPR